MARGFSTWVLERPDHERSAHLSDSHWSDDQLIQQMLPDPILINRPVVVTPWGVKLCRPSEAVLDILPLPQPRSFSKEDGEPVIDSRGQQV